MWRLLVKAAAAERCALQPVEEVSIRVAPDKNGTTRRIGFVRCVSLFSATTSKAFRRLSARGRYCDYQTRDGIKPFNFVQHLSFSPINRALTKQLQHFGRAKTCGIVQRLPGQQTRTICPRRKNGCAIATELLFRVRLMAGQLRRYRWKVLVSLLPGFFCDDVKSGTKSSN